MYIVDRLKKITKISTGGLEHFVITEICEETYETFAEEVHEIIERFAPGSTFFVEYDTNFDYFIYYSYNIDMA